MALPDDENAFRFAISLSVLNHLGRNLYRNFITVLGEAISNSWDADARNVWIDIDRENSVFSIKDDGIGMGREDFQSKFLKIGYSKRVDGNTKTASNRPFIGAKGIGKLALLSCAKRISVFSKTCGATYIGGVIDNSGLDEAITQDLQPEEYPLEDLDFDLITDLQSGHDQGTIIVFEETKDQLKNSIPHIKKLLAMSFRFSLFDEEFTIFVNGEEVTMDDLKDLTDATEFLWLINQHTDDYVSELGKLKSDAIYLTTALDIRGFLATVEKPRNLKITGTEERATIDLFVNGRLREKNILRHIPTQRIVESYIYGQIHFDSMDQPGKDPFTSSREGIVEGDENFQSLLDFLKRDVLPRLFDDWDKLRWGRGKEGDEENPRKTRKERKARDLYSAAREEYKPDDDAPAKDQVETWLDDLQDDATFNSLAYIDCFLSENLLRKFIKEKKLALKDGALNETTKWEVREADRKREANISFEIREDQEKLSYLGMDYLSVTAEGSKSAPLCKDAVRYKPVRNVVGHTGLLTKTAKNHLTITYENIKGRVKQLVSGRTKP